jgi:hypothetical protein
MTTPTAKKPRKRQVRPGAERIEAKAAFCAKLASCCNVGHACKAADISRDTAYEWRNTDKDFERAWDEAMKRGVSALEDIAHDRAFEGVAKPVYQMGEKVGTITEYSDTLAIFLLKAHAPEKYRENSKIELAGQVAIGKMTEDEMRAELALLTSQLTHGGQG